MMSCNCFNYLTRNCYEMIEIKIIVIIVRYNSECDYYLRVNAKTNKQ